MMEFKGKKIMVSSCNCFLNSYWLIRLTLLQAEQRFYHFEIGQCKAFFMVALWLIHCWYIETLLGCLIVVLDCAKVIFQNILIKSECFIVFMLFYYGTQLQNKLSFELNYHDQKIRRTPTHDIWEHWTPVSTLLSLISSVYHNLHHWRLN